MHLLICKMHIILTLLMTYCGTWEDALPTVSWTYPPKMTFNKFIFKNPMFPITD